VADHPVFGKMTPKEWSVFAYRHMDHHLSSSGFDRMDKACGISWIRWSDLTDSIRASSVVSRVDIV